MELLVTTLLAFAASVLLTWVARRMAIARGLMDRPNERSSHSTPTPQGGGAAVVVVVIGALAVFVAQGKIPHEVFATLAGGGLLVAAVGLIDDWRLLSTNVRLAAHFCAALWAVLWLDGLPPIQIGGHVIELGWAEFPLGVLGIVWSINLFNFMDGIDGIAASEAGFVTIAAVLILTGGASYTFGIALIGWTVGAACCGFLIWNWPPARIFLGDTGSGYLGYSLACFSIICARENPVALLVFVILGAVFIVDATVTFVRRIARHERYDVGHRTHGYQRLARKWGSHRPVTLLVLATNVLVLLPASAWAGSQPSLAAHIAGAILLLVSVTALTIGSGRREEP